MLNKYKLDTIHLSCEMTQDFLSSCTQYCDEKAIDFERTRPTEFKHVFNGRLFWVSLLQMDNEPTAFCPATIQLHSVLCNRYGLSMIKTLRKHPAIRNIQFTRIDVCVDMIDESFRLVRGKVRNKPPKAKVFTETIEDSGTLLTVYFKSKSFWIRVYDKAVEEKAKTYRLIEIVPDDWKRFEIEFKKDYLKRYNVRAVKNLSLKEMYDMVNSLIITFQASFSLNPRYDRLIKNMISGGNRLHTYKPVYDSQIAHDSAMKFEAVAKYIAANKPETFREIIDDDDRRIEIVKNYHDKKRLQSL